MSPSAAFRLLRFHEVDVSLVGDSLALRGTDAARAAVRDAVRECKPVITALLRAGTFKCKMCDRILDPDGTCWRCRIRPCRSCGKPTPSTLISLCDRCAVLPENQ